MKKKVLAAVVLVILALCLFGCSKNEKSGDGSVNDVSSNAGSYTGSNADGSVNSNAGGDFSYAIDNEGNIVDFDGNTYNGKDFSIDDSGNIYDNHSGTIVGSVVEGNNMDSDSYFDDGSYVQDDYAQNTFSDHARDVLSLNLYKVDDDTIHIRIIDNNKSGIMGKGVNQVYVRIMDSEDMEFASISFSSDYASFGYYTNNHSDWHGADYTENLSMYANMVGATFGGSGLAAGIGEGLRYSIEVYTNSGNADPVYGEGKTGAVQIVSENELTELVAQEALEFVPKEKAHSIWAGQYVYSNSHYDEDYNYVYEYGVADISITDKGAIRVDLEGSGEKKTYVLQEKDYEEINYEYGTVIEGSASMPGTDYHNSANLRYSKEVDRPASYSLTTESYKDNQYYDYSYSFYPIGSAAAVAPASFSDTDKYGYVDAILKDKSNFLYPTTDSYIFNVTAAIESVYNDSTGDYTYYHGVKVTLYELDVNDICLNYKTVTTFEDSAAASAIYAYQQSWYSGSWSHFELMGNETRLTGRPSYYYGRLYYLKSYSTYDGMHYADYMYSSDGHMDYIYSSKPFDSSKSNPGLELVKIMAAIPSGGHRSLDSQKASMATSISPNLYTGADISFSVYGEDSNYSVDNYYAVYDGLTAYIISYKEEWENGGYANYVCVDEITFGYEEATATRNKYKVDDFSNVTVTLDNYKSVTPDSTETHRYDMTRVR